MLFRPNTKSEDSDRSYVVDVDGYSVTVPVVYPKLTAMMAFFPIDYKKAKAQIDDPRVDPVRIKPNTAVLGITVFDYIECPTGPYRELAISVPSYVNGFFKPPVLPLLYDTPFKSFGYHTHLLAMDTDIARHHAIEIFGYPTYESTIDVEIDEQDTQMSIGARNGADDILSIRMTKPSGYRQLKDKTYDTYFKVDGILKKVVMTVTTLASESRKGRDCVCSFGTDEISRTYLTHALLSDVPLKYMHYKQTVETLASPQPVV